MSEDKRFERRARTWLEDGPTRAPERAIEAALATIEVTPQERDLRVPWRMPVMSLPIRLAAVAMLVALAAGGTYLVAGALPDTAPSVTPVPALESPGPALESPSSGAAPDAMAAYRRDRNDICNAAMIAKEPIAERYARVLDPGATETERAEALVALKELVVLADGVADDLAAIEVPPDFVAEHATNLAQYRDLTTLVRQVVALLEAGNLADAAAVDVATNPIGRQISAWEAEHGVFACP